MTPSSLSLSSSRFHAHPCIRLPPEAKVPGGRAPGRDTDLSRRSLEWVVTGRASADAEQRSKPAHRATAIRAKRSPPRPRESPVRGGRNTMGKLVLGGRRADHREPGARYVRQDRHDRGTPERGLSPPIFVLALTSARQMPSSRVPASRNVRLRDGPAGLIWRGAAAHGRAWPPLRHACSVALPSARPPGLAPAPRWPRRARLLVPRAGARAPPSWPCWADRLFPLVCS